MNITNFDELLAAARAQPQPQRLLLVFAGAELPACSTPEQRSAFDAGHGGELTPLMCVDKTPEEIDSFAALCAEAGRVGPPWAIVFAAALSGHGGQAPDSDAAEQPLRRMVEAIRSNALDGLIPFDREGCAVSLG